MSTYNRAMEAYVILTYTECLPIFSLTRADPALDDEERHTFAKETTASFWSKGIVMKSVKLEDGQGKLATNK